MIREEGVVLKIMAEKGFLGYPSINDESSREVLQTKLDHLRLQIAALREYVMINSLDSLILESKKLSALTVWLKRLTLILAGLAFIQIVVTLLR